MSTVTIIRGVAVPIAPPAAGKTTLRTQFQELGYAVLSRDDTRFLLTGDMSNMGAELRVTGHLGRERDRLYREKKATYLDATNLKHKYRQEEVMEAHRAGLPTVALVRAWVPFQKLQERNLGRARAVPEDVMERMYRQWNDILLDPDMLKREGFDQVVFFDDETRIVTHELRTEELA